MFTAFVLFKTIHYIDNNGGKNGRAGGIKGKVRKELEEVSKVNLYSYIGDIVWKGCKTRPANIKVMTGSLA